MLILDTNAVIGYLGNDRGLMNEIDARGAQGQEIAISTVTIIEMLSYPTLTSKDQNLIEGFIARAKLLDLTPTIARHAATMRREFHLATADAAIAATAMVYRAPIITRDKAFKKLSHLKIIVP